MTIYILKAYPDAHKWNSDSWIIGYFTNKALLRQAIVRYADDLGIADYNREDVWRAFWAGKIIMAGRYMESGDIEAIEANTINSY